MTSARTAWGRRGAAILGRSKGGGGGGEATLGGRGERPLARCGEDLEGKIGRNGRMARELGIRVEEMASSYTGGVFRLEIRRYFFSK